jgi:hypothetical protein
MTFLRPSAESRSLLKGRNSKKTAETETVSVDKLINSYGIIEIMKTKDGKNT